MLTIARQGDGEDELDLGKHSRHLLLHLRSPQLSLEHLEHLEHLGEHSRHVLLHLRSPQLSPSCVPQYCIFFKLSRLNINLGLAQCFDFHSMLLSFASPD